MGTGLVPIHFLAIIVQSQVVYERLTDLVTAPVTFNLFRVRVDPDRRAASCHQDLRAHVLFPAVHIVAYVVSAFHPVAGCLRTLLQLSELFFGCDLLRAGDGVCNVLTHPAKLLFACLSFLL